MLASRYISLPSARFPSSASECVTNWSLHTFTCFKQKYSFFLFTPIFIPLICQIFSCKKFNLWGQLTNSCSLSFFLIYPFFSVSKEQQKNFSGWKDLDIYLRFKQSNNKSFRGWKRNKTRNQQVAHWDISKLHDVTSKKTIWFIITIMRVPNLSKDNIQKWVQYWHDTHKCIYNCTTEA